MFIPDGLRQGPHGAAALEKPLAEDPLTRGLHWVLNDLISAKCLSVGQGGWNAPSEPQPFQTGCHEEPRPVRGARR